MPPCDYSIYPKNWKSEIVPAILKRAGEIREGKSISREARCEFCGVENHYNQVVLTIAHLDHDAENHAVEYDRLKALCQKCHNNYDMPRRRENARKTREKKKLLQSLF